MDDANNSGWTTEDNTLIISGTVKIPANNSVIYTDSSNITLRPANQSSIVYKFKEPEILQELRDYIDKTYDQHYVGTKKKTQTVEYIYDTLGNTDFMRANIIKYASRLDKKVGESSKKDVMKLLHYAIMMYYYEFKQDN